jgi:hypothetical protein
MAATLKNGTPNPEFQPDLPTCAMQMLSVDSIPPEWSFDESLCVRFPSHEAAEVRVEELRALGIRCHAQTLPRDPNQRPAFESLPQPTQPNNFDVERQIAASKKDCAGSIAASAVQPHGGGKADCGVRTRPSKRRKKSARTDAASRAAGSGDKKFWWREDQYA